MNKECIRTIFIIFLLGLLIPIFAEDVLFKVTEDTPVWKEGTSFYWENRIDRIIQKGTIVKGVDMPFLTDVINTSVYAQKVICESKKYIIQSSVLIPVNTKELFDTSVITDDNDQIFWKNGYYLDVLRSKDRDTLLKYEKYHIDSFIKLENREAYPREWWENDTFLDRESLLFQTSFSFIGFTPFSFWIHAIESIEKGYKISVANYALWLGNPPEPPESLYYNFYIDKPIYDLYLIYDGDYLDVYVESLDNKVISLVKIDKTIQEELANLFAHNKADLSRITYWPRRANGSMDYPPPVNMSSCKTTHRTIDNLRLRSAPNTTGEIVTTLRKGSAVQVLETGAMQTIDGITAPWVKVLSETGYEGWCFSGYLREN